MSSMSSKSGMMGMSSKDDYYPAPESPNVFSMSSKGMEMSSKGGSSWIYPMMPMMSGKGYGYYEGSGAYSSASMKGMMGSKSSMAPMSYKGEGSSMGKGSLMSMSMMSMMSKMSIRMMGGKGKGKGKGVVGT